MKVLSTKWLDTAVCEILEHAGIELTEKNFIITEPLSNDLLKEELASLAATQNIVVFTSRNAVYAVTRQVKNAIEWKVCCISGKTKKKVLKYFPAKQIIVTADDATALAKKIIAKGITKVIFFCGDKRRDELPATLQHAGIDVKEIVVYNTIETAEKMNEVFDAIVFFSPTAVKSFFSLNKPNKTTTFFAIGNTTATEIKKHTNSKIIIAGAPTQEALAATVIEYYKQSVKM